MGPMNTVYEVVDATRAFTEAMEKADAAGLSEVTSQVRKHELAWMVDRLDDVRATLADLLESIAESVEEYGANGENWNEVLAALESAGEGLYGTVRELDPDGKRANIASPQHVVS